MAGQIPRAFVDDLLARVDIVEVIEQYLPLRKAGRDFQALCPFHHEKSPSFTVSQTKQFYYCFGCGASGSAIGFLMEYAHMNFPDAVSDLAARAGMQVPAEIQAGNERQASLTPIFDILAAAQRYFARQLRDHPAAPKAVAYLKGRGVSGEIAASYGIGYAPPGWDNLLKSVGIDAAATNALTEAGLLVPRDGGHYDRFRDRIMFPIHDHRGRVVGFGGRVLGTEEPKYLNSPETPVFHKGHELYGLYRARRETPGLTRLLVVEGYMDVVALAQFGVSNAVATLGTATTRDHLERLFRAVPEVTFCFDGDNAGRRAAWRALETALPVLREGRVVGFLFLPNGEDPDTWVRKAGPDVFSSPTAVTPLSEFLFESLSAQVNMQTLDGRARLVELAKPLLRQVPDGALKTLLYQRLGQLSHIDAGEIQRQTGGSAVQRPTAPTTTARANPVPSLVRVAIGLLLHYPEFALGVADPPALRACTAPGATLLADLIALIQARPDITPGALVEHWRGTEMAAHLSKLLREAPTVGAAGAAIEFHTALEKLRLTADKSLIDQMVNRVKPSEYSVTEKAALRAALAARKPVRK